jgi:hypothetical protein
VLPNPEELSLDELSQVDLQVIAEGLIGSRVRIPAGRSNYFAEAYGLDRVRFHGMFMINLLPLISLLMQIRSIGYTEQNLRYYNSLAKMTIANRNKFRGELVHPLCHPKAVQGNVSCTRGGSSLDK